MLQLHRRPNIDMMRLHLCCPLQCSLAVQHFMPDDGPAAALRQASRPDIQVLRLGSSLSDPACCQLLLRTCKVR